MAGGVYLGVSHDPIPRGWDPNIPKRFWDLLQMCA